MNDENGDERRRRMDDDDECSSARRLREIRKYVNAITAQDGTDSFFAVFLLI